MIHPTATIDKGAELGSAVKVGPYCYIGSAVKLGDGCDLTNNVTIVGQTTVGSNCVFFTNSVIGEIPQDLKFKGGLTELIIGEDNHFRECVTVHAGTEVGGAVTRIGSHNRFLVGVHLAHDCRIGNHVVISNNVQIAGHVHVEDHVTMGGLCGIHHFVTVGRYTMLGGLARVSSDLPPYMVIMGSPSVVRGVNSEGLKRWGLSPEDIDALSEAYKLLYSKRSSQEVPFAERLEQLHRHNGHNAHVEYLYRFIKRTLSVGNHGRYLEAARADTAEDRKAFFDSTNNGDPQ